MAKLPVASQYSRAQEGFRFEFGGLKTNSTADSMPQGKYPYAQNIRSTSNNSVKTRPGQVLKFAAGTLLITDIRAFVALNTDGLPRYLARDSGDQIWLDNGVNVGHLTTGGFANPGVSMIPFRPNESPNPYLYIGNLSDYQKFSAPSATNVVTQQKVGIAEPQSPPDAATFSPLFQSLGDPNFQAGTAGASATSNRTNDTVAAAFPWPNSPRVFSVQVGVGVQYQRFQSLTFAAANPGLVQDVYQQFAYVIAISSIFYFTGATGRCVVVPANIAAAPGNESHSLYSQAFTSGLRRGALVQIGAETCMVLSVSTGPDGTISFETSTVAAHTSADVLTTVPAIQVVMLSGATPAGSIISGQRTYAVTAGIGTQSSGPFTGFTINQGFSPDDYISFAVNIDNLANLNEIKILFDVGDGSFTQNFYYYTIRPADIVAGIGNVLTQLAVAQIVTQRAVIDEEQAATANNQGTTASSAQTSPGSSQWSQFYIPISAFTRVGDDQTKTLQQITKIQFLYNANATINVKHGTQDFYLAGGSEPDVGDIGAPLLYRVRPRSAATGVKGNPSPATRYGISPRRQLVTVTLPSAAYDPQIDTWDIERYGGSITSWRYVGSTLSTAPTFTDNFSDDAVNAGDALEFDNFEPWPTVGLPNNGVTNSVTGTTALITSTDPNVPFYLPGTLVQLGGQRVYTLWARPTPTFPGGTTYLFQFVENAGAATVISYGINEPAVANRHLPYLWGPDASGTVFGVGDQFRPGTVSFAKNFAPDSVPDSYNIEISPPTEPLMGGEVLDGLSFVASTERWWALYPQPQNTSQRYNVVQQPFPRGLAAPYGHCTDGVSIYWWAKDGIWSSSKGSLTDDDLYNLFPHDGVVGENQTYAGQTTFAPDYSRIGAFRLTYANYYLYATYQDSLGVYHTLVYDTRRGAWSNDIYSPVVTAFYHPEQQAGSLVNPGTRYDELIMASFARIGLVSSAKVFTQTDLTNDFGGPFASMIATREFDGGDLRAGSQWGDLYVDCLPSAGNGGASAALTVQPLFLGAPISPVQTIATSLMRSQFPVSLGGGILSTFLGALFQWTDDFTIQAAPTRLFAWQPSFIPKPELITDRFSDWDDADMEGAKWIQGFVMRADTFNQVKGLAIRDSDTQAIHPFTPQVLHNGESEIAYSFNVPFIAHMVRVETTDAVPWRWWELRWVAEPTPETAETWQTQATTHGMLGYMHVRQISITYASQAPVTFTITSFDGTSPVPIVLPTTAGAVRKLVFPCTFNKGQLFFYRASCTIPFQIFVEKSEVLVGSWGRQDSYANRPLIGSEGGDQARI